MVKIVQKKRTQITTTVRNDLHENLKRYSSETDIPISKLLDRALELYFKEVGFKPEESNEE